ncbi:hypothetical protein [Pedobacter hiemivivus]|uniref:hypothetical protein n=1 Tax=Pedobacter hiemivivus TaxID=2530454 RepID=UPI00146E4065|nr:hypothetical protein [Pedobacter hiemivivus]
MKISIKITVAKRNANINSTPQCKTIPYIRARLPIVVAETIAILLLIRKAIIPAAIYRN